MLNADGWWSRHAQICPRYISTSFQLKKYKSRCNHCTDGIPHPPMSMMMNLVNSKIVDVGKMNIIDGNDTSGSEDAEDVDNDYAGESQCNRHNDIQQHPPIGCQKNKK